MSVTELMSRLVEARTRWFKLVEAIEKEASCSVDERELEALVDDGFSGRDEVTADEANSLLLRVSTRPIGLARTGT